MSCQEDEKPIPCDWLTYNACLWHSTNARDLAIDIEKGRKGNVSLAPDSLLLIKDTLNSRSLLQLAITKNRFDIARDIVNRVGTVNDYEGLYGSSAIILAAGNVDGVPLEFFEFLIQNGANINDQRVGGWYDDKGLRTTPLYEAVNRGNYPLIDYIIKNGGNLDMFVREDYTPLNLAVFRDMRVVYMLLEGGLNYEKWGHVSQRTGKKLNILQMLRRIVRKPDSREYEWKMKVVDFLAARGLDYWNEPIPKDIEAKIRREYPKSHQQVLAEY